jgi:hypothetical protein
MFHSLIACTRLLHHSVTAKIIKIIQEERILHDPHAIHFVTLIKRIIRSILNFLIFQYFFFLLRVVIFAALAAPTLVLYSEPKNLPQPFIYVKKSAYQFFSV